MASRIEQTLTVAQASGDASTESAELAGRGPTIKYNLWPRPPKPQAVQTLPWNSYPSSEKAMALSAGRSPTALSDTSVNLQKGTMWRRGGSLSNRRKISVPELGSNPKAILGAGSSMDSPTIPGRPPLRKVASAGAHHGRSSSAPSWRDCAFGDAMMHSISEPRVNAMNSPWPLPIPEDASPATYNTTRPLSPILSPTGSATPTTAVPVLPKPVLSPLEIPPKVPPKSPPHDGSMSPSKGNTKGSPSKWILKRSPSKSGLNGAEQPTFMLSSSPPGSATTSPKSRSTERNAMSPPPRTETANESTESVVHRGRPVKRSKQSRDLGAGEDSEGWKLPTGFKPLEAVLVLPESEKDLLKKQASGQAEKFEVLGAKHVDSLSKELRALDERCNYLRETYRSLRSGRQKLQHRMITYLKNDSITFSKENLIKQEEALVELDKSIDDWMVKLELAENRRLRVRQKLLEHVAAAMTLTNTAPVHPTYTTPPGSPTKNDTPEPLKVERKEVESIKVYADNQVLNLFTDIEQAVAQLCEAY